jgi:tetratricopeptide (TPR) repeat protein
MRFYRRTTTDKINHLKRCLFEAGQGRVRTALERVHDLADEFPRDADVLHVEARIRKDWLGQGARACELSEAAYHLDHSFANAHNAALFARTEDGFRRWSEIALRVGSNEHEFCRMVDELRTELESGIPYWQFLAAKAQRRFNSGSYGEAAALFELALLSEQMPSEQEVAARRVRAQSLRALDEAANRRRDSCGECFPPEERLALQTALEELEKALTADPYEPELWNLKAAWCVLMKSYQDAVAAADHAISLRPSHYAKPHLNKAEAMRNLGRYDEARAIAQTALLQAQGGDARDLELAQQAVTNSQGPARQDSGSAAIEKIMKGLLDGARNTAEQELRQQGDSLGRLAEGVVIRALKLGSDHSAEYVPLIAEMLSDYTPDAVSCLLGIAARTHERLVEHLLNAALVVAAHSEGVRQEDAARLLALAIVLPGKLTAVRTTYRKAILAPAASATDALSQLDSILRTALQLLHPLLPGPIADQPPLDEQERARAAQQVLAQLAPSSPWTVYLFVGIAVVAIGGLVAYLLGKG